MSSHPTSTNSTTYILVLFSLPLLSVFNCVHCRDPHYYNYIIYPTMPAGCPVVDLEPMKEHILHLHCTGNSSQEIALEVGSKERTIQRRLQKWGIWKRAPPVKTEDKIMRAY